MTDDLDLQLQQVFDERLSRLQAPERRERSRSWRRLAVGVVTASLIFAGAGFAMDVNTVAAANGAACAGVLAKVQLWVRSHVGEAAEHQASAAQHHPC